MAPIIADYLVIGAGTAGIAFTDALLSASDVDVVVVDRRHGPGGHGNDTCPSENGRSARDNGLKLLGALAWGAGVT